MYGQKPPTLQTTQRIPALPQRTRLQRFFYEFIQAGLLVIAVEVVAFVALGFGYLILLLLDEIARL